MPDQYPGSVANTLGVRKTANGESATVSTTTASTETYVKVLSQLSGVKVLSQLRGVKI